MLTVLASSSDTVRVLINLQEMVEQALDAAVIDGTAAGRFFAVTVCGATSVRQSEISVHLRVNVE